MLHFLLQSNWLSNIYFVSLIFVVRLLVVSRTYSGLCHPDIPIAVPYSALRSSWTLRSSFPNFQSRVRRIMNVKVMERPDRIKAITIIKADVPSPTRSLKGSPTARDMYKQIKRYKKTNIQEQIFMRALCLLQLIIKAEYLLSCPITLAG